MLILMAFLSVAFIVTTIGHWFTYKKSGQPGWYSLVPFLNGYKRAGLLENRIG